MTNTKYGLLCAEVYNITKPIGGQYPDVPYYIRHLSKIGGRILEAAVGTGRLLVPLLEAGFNVEGLDNSEEMLAYCRRHCAERHLNPVLYYGDMTTLDLPGKFSAIIVTWGSFMLLETRARAIAALRAFAKHLEPNGRIFIDLEIPVEDFKSEGQVRQLNPIECKDKSMIMMQITSHVDMLEQLNVSFLRYEKWKDGKLEATELQRFPLHWFGRDEFMMCLRENGYKDITVCANYQDDLKLSHYKDEMCFSATLD